MSRSPASFNRPKHTEVSGGGDGHFHRKQRQSSQDPSDNSLPPAIIATLVFAQHARPFQFLPMTFVPVLLGSSYANLNGYKTDAAGTSAAWSGLYMLLASRRRHKFMKRFGARGMIRGATMGLCAVQLLAGGISFTFGDRKREDHWIGKDRGEK